MPSNPSAEAFDALCAAGIAPWDALKAQFHDSHVTWLAPGHAVPASLIQFNAIASNEEYHRRNDGECVLSTFNAKVAGGILTLETWYYIDWAEFDWVRLHFERAIATYSGPAFTLSEPEVAPFEFDGTFLDATEWCCDASEEYSQVFRFGWRCLGWLTYRHRPTNIQVKIFAMESERIGLQIKEIECLQPKKLERTSRRMRAELYTGAVDKLKFDFGFADDGTRPDEVTV